MKKTLKEYFSVIIAVVGVFFAVAVYFGTGGMENGLFADTGEALAGSDDRQILSNVPEGAVPTDMDIPLVKYAGGAWTVGTSADFRELFRFIFEDGRSISGKDAENYTMYFKDVTDMSGNSVCEKLQTKDIESMEEIPSAFVFDKETKHLYFHKSGKFMMYVRVYYSADTYVDYEFAVPVEVG